MQSPHLPGKHDVVHHHVSVSRDLYLCRYSHVIIMSSASILCLREKRDKQFMGDIFFARAKQTLTQDIQPMLFQC